MAHITIIKDDSSIYNDGEVYMGCDMSGLPDGMHALQWDGEKGHIEYTDPLISNKKLTSSDQIKTNLGVSLSEIIERWSARKAELDND